MSRVALSVAAGIAGLLLGLAWPRSPVVVAAPVPAAPCPAPVAPGPVPVPAAARPRQPAPPRPAGATPASSPVAEKSRGPDDERPEDPDLARLVARRTELVAAARPTPAQLSAFDEVIDVMNARLLAVRDAAPVEPPADPNEARRATLATTVETLQILLETESELAAVWTDDQREVVPPELLDPTAWLAPALLDEPE